MKSTKLISLVALFGASLAIEFDYSAPPAAPPAPQIPNDVDCSEGYCDWENPDGSYCEYEDDQTYCWADGDDYEEEWYQQWDTDYGWYYTGGYDDYGNYVEISESDDGSEWSKSEWNSEWDTYDYIDSEGCEEHDDEYGGWSYCDGYYEEYENDDEYSSHGTESYYSQDDDDEWDYEGWYVETQSDESPYDDYQEAEFGEGWADHYHSQETDEGEVDHEWGYWNWEFFDGEEFQGTYDCQSWDSWWTDAWASDCAIDQGLGEVQHLREYQDWDSGLYCWAWNKDEFECSSYDWSTGYYEEYETDEDILSLIEDLAAEFYPLY